MYGISDIPEYNNVVCQVKECGKVCITDREINLFVFDGNYFLFVCNECWNNLIESDIDIEQVKVIKMQTPLI